MPGEVQEGALGLCLCRRNHKCDAKRDAKQQLLKLSSASLILLNISLILKIFEGEFLVLEELYLSSKKYGYRIA